MDSAVQAADNGTATPASLSRKVSSAAHGSSVPSTPRHNSFSGGSAPQSALKSWFLVLTGLSRLVSDPRTEVRSMALQTLFLILNAHGHVFTPQTWRTVFHGVLFPIFDDVRYANEAHRGPGSANAAIALSSSPSPEPAPAAAAASAPQRKPTAVSEEGGDAGATRPPAGVTRSNSAHYLSQQQPAGGDAAPARRSSMLVNGTPASSTSSSGSSSGFDQTWLSTTCFTALSSLVDLFVRFHPSVCFLLPELLRLLQGCIVQAHAEALAKIGVRCLSVLLHKIGGELSVGDWWVVLRAVEDTLTDVLPTELVSAKLRAALLMQPAQGPLPVVYEPLVRDPRRVREASNSEEDAAAASAASSTGAATAAPAAADSASAAGTPSRPVSTPVSHSRSASLSLSSPAASSASSASPTLPFALAPMQTRLKVQLWVVEGLFQCVMRFFPRNDLAVQRLREEQNGEEDAAAEANGAAAAAGTSSPPASASSVSTLFDSSDRRVLGCLTPVQALYAVDLLSLVLNTTHAFNADISLRRRLHSVGFVVPPPNMAPPTHGAAAQQPAASAHAPNQPAQAVSTVPPSPAPVPQYAAPLPSLPTSASASAAHPAAAAAAGPAGAKPPARLPQLFYHEAHVLRLSMDILFRLVACGHGSSASDAGAPSSLWQSEVRVSLPLARASDASNVSLSAPSSPTSGTLISLAEERVVALAVAAAGEYVTKTRAGQLVSLEHADEVLVGLTANVASFPRDLFLHALPRFYPLFCELIEFAGTPAIRHAIRQLFANNIAALLQQQGMQVGPAASVEAAKQP